jgi:succinate dehydrogenase flavin-adding protein (antitoxin of CptAB toxin-antitoxin module)
MLAQYFFVDTQRELLHGVLNRIIPAADAFPGAGDLGVVAYLDTVIGRSAELRWLFSRGVTQLDIISQELYAQAFGNLSDDQQDAVLRRVEATCPEFFAALVTHAYSGYYSNPLITRLLAIDVRPPQPQGYELEPLDLSLLDRVRQRKPVYRPV